MTTTNTEHASHEYDNASLMVLSDPPPPGATCALCEFHGVEGSPAVALVWEHNWVETTYTGAVAFCDACMDAPQVPFCRQCADELIEAAKR